MKTLLVDGQWNLKRNFKKRQELKTSTGYLCGGSFGFIESLKTAMNRVQPDRVVVMWDGFHSGKLRYDIYPPYKANRNKDWEKTQKAIATDGLYNPQDLERVEMLKQKIQVQNYLDELYVRQAEVDLIEADDLIAQYILRSKSDDEEIIVFSRDKDYLQLISDKVSVMTSDSAFFVNKEEYESKYGHIIDNELLFKCFEGDKSDKIEGVKGITRETLIKYFPNIKKEKYLYSRLVEESLEAQKKKKLKIYDKVLESESILYRNARLMNLKKPFLNDEAINKVDAVKHGILGSDRSVEKAVSLFIRDGMISHLQNGSLEDFFSPFYRVMTKEIEYSKNMKI